MSLELYHLHLSQSERVVWLLEEMGIPYTLKVFKRPSPSARAAQLLDNTHIDHSRLEQAESNSNDRQIEYQRLDSFLFNELRLATFDWASQTLHKVFKLGWKFPRCS